MKGRESTTYGNSSVLFPAVSANILALQESYLDLYCSNIEDFADILPILHKKGLFKHIEPIPYSMCDFLKAYFSDASPYARLSPMHLLAKPLPHSDFFQPLAETDTVPALFTSLSKPIHSYMAVLGEILNNQLAQRPYENLRDQENVTEQEHALQAGKIALLLGMQSSDVLALLFHDVARIPTADNALHGHSNHCEEGSTILSPLGLTVDYSGQHAFAKYLLYAFCPEYKALISPVSTFSLSIQEKKLQQSCLALQNMDAKQLANFMFQIMFMRLIDDMSKVPELELRKLLGGEKTDYFTSDMIQTLVKNQLFSTLKNLAENSNNAEETVRDMEAKLEAALSLMLKAPDLYDKYKDRIGTPKPTQACHA